MKVSSTFPESFCITFCLNKGVPKEFLCIRCFASIGAVGGRCKIEELEEEVGGIDEEEVGGIDEEEEGRLG